MTLEEIISEKRKSAGISQEKLAEMVGVSRQAVTKWESGKGKPDTENLIKLAEIFGCSLDELCGNEKPQPKAGIHPGSHILVLISLLILTAYCVIGGITGTFGGETLVLFIILAIPMHCFTHLVFWGMVKSGEFAILAGYDSSVKYDTENMKRYVSGLDFMLGLETASCLLLMAATALILPESDIPYILLIGYIISFVAGIFFVGYKYGDKIYLDPEDAKKAKRGFPASAILVGEILFSVGAFMLLFSLREYRNNTAEPLPMLGMMFLSLGFALGGYLSESARLKKEPYAKPFFGKPFIICNAIAICAVLAMALF